MSRIVSFPEPFPDEDFRSVLYRYHLRSGNPEFVHTQYELFGRRTYKQKIIPKGLKLMLDKLPLGHTYSAEEILYRYTWYGLCKSFLTFERNEKWFHVILHGSNLRNAKGQPPLVGKKSVLASEIKYCAACVLNDLKTYGEVMVHRQHQIAFLEICPIHLVRLHSECPKCSYKYGNTQTGVLLRTSQCKCGYYLPNEHIELNSVYQQQIDLFNDLVYIRDNQNKFNIDTTIIKFMNQLNTQNFITPKGTILKRELLAYFKSAYSNIEIYKFDELDMKGDYFRTYLFRRDHMVNFIYFYVLLARLLCGSFRSLVETDIEYAINIPFGNGPWACKNSRCLLLDVPRVNRCVRNVNDSSGVYSIKYNCEICNYTIIIRGNKTTCSKRKIIKGVNKTVNAINELNDARHEIAATSEVKFEHKLYINRLRMGNLLNERSYRTRSEIRNQANYLYAWLMHYDKEWLESKIPLKVERKNTKLNFSSIDQDLQQKICEAGRSISSDYHLPIYRGTILGKLSPLDRNRFRKYCCDKLPLAVQEIDKFTETKKQFLIRSIPRYYSKLKLGNASRITISQFKELASISFYKNGDNEVDEHIRKFLEEKGNLI
ncbi:TnsD family Tn7-like transposition protein [Paenibacillus xylanexedens]|uniref:TnsD family Tn7-like transposition protein n=1 Tax=Paenibacillus xylanexedens TaxID=528191 RepID=UPI0011A98287|nr:TnsD family Tn7-like transposition protein [Paenibacillus xylanexedens]